MTRYLIVGAMLVAGVLGVLLLSGGEKPYTVEMHLANAGGLRNGSPVVIGGVPVGGVKIDATQREVTVKLEIEDQYAPLDKSSTASIISQNVLGQKQVSVTEGAEADPAPDGYVLPRSQVRQATDLDQLLSTLDPDTRARLAVVLNETGTAFARRKMDFQTFLTDFAPAVDVGGELLRELSLDNQNLDRLLVASDDYIAEFTANKERLGRMLNSIRQTTETVAARRVELRNALSRAPAALRAARGLLTELERTTGPLATTAQLLTRSAPSLAQTFEKLGPFTDATVPVLKDIPYLAKAVDYLDDDTTHPLEHAVRIVRDLKPIAERELPPVTDTLDKSADNVVAILANWAHAIQFRDGLGHVFRGEASFSPNTYETLIKTFGGSAGLPVRRPDRARPPAGAKRPATAPAPAAPAPAKAPLEKTKDDLQNLLGTVLRPTVGVQQQVQDLVDGLGLKPGSDKAQIPLLDYLLKP